MRTRTIYQQLQHFYSFRKFPTFLCTLFLALFWGKGVQCQDTTSLQFTEYTGSDNPLDFLVVQSSTDNLRSVSFADLDGDGIKDMWINNYETNMTPPFISTRTMFYYFKNRGTVVNPYYAGSSTNGFASTNNRLYLSTENVTFVDVDGDGDQDMFRALDGASGLVTDGTLEYFENTGTATNPLFTPRDSASNPLQEANNHFDSITFSSNNLVPTLYTSFIDVDNDGDQDCFVAPSIITSNNRSAWPAAYDADRVLYFENVGSATNPNFVKQTAINNPLNTINTSLATGKYLARGLKFADLDRQKDGDLDVTFFAYDSTTASSEFWYYENVSNTSVSSFINTDNKLLDSLVAQYNVPVNSYAIQEWVDLDGNGVAELIVFDGGDVRYFKDTTTYNSMVKLPKTIPLHSYPNPTTGLLQLEQPMTGQLSIYNTLGQKVYSKELEQAQQIHLGQLEQGLYFLHLKTKEEEYQQTVILKP